VAIDAEFMQGDLTVTRFADYKNAVLRVYPQMAKCNPDIFIITHEPSTMAYRMNLKISPLEWQQFVIDGNKVVKTAAPATKVGVGFLYYEMPTFLQCLDLPLDYLTLDIYDATHFDIYTQMVQLVQQHGKKVYIEETWGCLYPGQIMADSTILTGEPAYQQANQLWFKALDMFAKAYNLTAISPFWSFTFFLMFNQVRTSSAFHTLTKSRVRSTTASGLRRSRLTNRQSAENNICSHISYFYHRFSVKIIIIFITAFVVSRTAIF